MNRKISIIVGICVAVCLALSLIIAPVFLLRGCEWSGNNPTNPVDGVTGTVRIRLHQSRFHRENAGVADGEEPAAGAQASLYDVTKMLDRDGITYKVVRDGEETNISYGGDVCYSNAQIKADSNRYYEKNYFQEGASILPGTCFKRAAYVENIGDEDIYVRITVLIPKGLAGMLKSSVLAQGGDSKEIGNEACASGEFYAPVKSEYTDSNGNMWVKYTYIRRDALRAGEMTYWSPVSSIQMDTDVSREDIYNAVENGWIDSESGSFEVYVNADGVYSADFADARTAFGTVGK